MINIIEKKQKQENKNNDYKIKLDKIRNKNLTVYTFDDLIELIELLEIEAIVTRPIVGSNNNNIYIIIEKGQIESIYILKQILNKNSSYNFILIHH